MKPIVYSARRDKPRGPTFHVVGVRHDASRRTLCSATTREAAETVIRLTLPTGEFRKLMVVEARLAPFSEPRRQPVQGLIGGSAAARDKAQAWLG